MAQEILKSNLTGISHSVASEMAGFSHTPACCLSKLRSSLGVGKKQLRVCLLYISSATEMLLYSSFGAPFMFLWSPYDSLKMIRSGFEEVSKMYVMMNVYENSMNHALLICEHMLIAPRIYDFVRSCRSMILLPTYCK